MQDRKAEVKAIEKSIALSLLFVIIFVIAMFGLTFAFFGLFITGNETASSMSADFIDLGTVTFTDGATINISDIYPMEESERLTKTFTITSASNEIDVGFKICLTVFQNTFVQTYPNEFTYTLSGTATNGTAVSSVSAQVPAASNTPYQLGSGILKANGDTHTYTFTIGLNEMGSDQESNKNKKFSGKLHIEPEKYTTGGSVWSE